MTLVLRLAAAALLFPSAVLAQTGAPTATNARAEQARRFRPESPARDLSVSGFSADQAPSSPGDPDLGEQVILRRREKATPFKLFTDVSGFYTSNAALTDRQTEDDFFFVGQVGASYQTRLATDLYTEVTVRQATFRYARLNELDFDSFNAGAGLTYLARPLWGVAFSLRYNYNRLTDGSEHDEFFQNHTLTVGAQKNVELSKAHYLYAGYASVLGWSDPVAPERDEHGIYLGYHLNLSRNVSAEASYRIALFDYNQGREDWNQNLTLAAKWDPTKWLSLSASTSLGINRSSRDAFDYDVFSAGLSIAGTITF